MFIFIISKHATPRHSFPSLKANNFIQLVYYIPPLPSLIFSAQRTTPSDQVPPHPHPIDPFYSKVRRRPISLSVHIPVLSASSTSPFVHDTAAITTSAAMDGMMGEGGRFPLEEWFWEMPICTRWWTTATVLTSAFVQCKVVNAFQLFYSYRSVFVNGQVRDPSESSASQRIPPDLPRSRY